jgi:hypothetical protein
MMPDTQEAGAAGAGEAARRRFGGALLILLSAGLLGGCAPEVRRVWFADRPTPRPASHPIQIYSTRAPECPYDEVGLVQARSITPATPMQEVLEAMRRGAREMGGDAVILRQVEGAASSESSGGLHPSTGLGGTVIRFSDPDCRRE